MMYKIIIIYAALSLHYANALPVYGEYGLSAPSAPQYVTSGNIHQFQNLRNNGKIQTNIHSPVSQAAKVTQTHHETHQDEHAPPRYQFRYEVQDEHSGDAKYHAESRDGDQTRGEYSFKEADGSVRTVKYVVDGKSGFKAIVIKSGTSNHPQGEVNKIPQLTSHGRNYHKGYNS